MEVFTLFCSFLLFHHVHGNNVTEIFRDDFNVDGFLNMSIWNVVNRASEVNSELEFYTPDAVSVKNGYLDIRSDKEPHGRMDYTSGRVDSGGKFAFLYGTIEWLVKMPKGQGLWPALWLSHPLCPAAVGCEAKYWPPAVMAVEMRGRQPQKVISTVYYHTTGGGYSSASKSITKKTDHSLGFHRYRLYWSSDCIITYIDDTEVLRVSDVEKIPQVPLQIVMNVAVGGSLPGSPNASTVFPTDMLIDYVVIRQGETVVCRNASMENSTVHSIAEAASGVPAFLAPLMGTLGSLAVLISVTVVAFLRSKSLRQRRGTMNKSLTRNMSAEDWEARWFNIAYVKTGDSTFDLLLKKFVGFIEIPPEDLQLSDQVLGKGEFGIVYRASVRGLRGQLPEKWTTVAVKLMIQTHLAAEEQRLLGEEIRVMIKVGRHLNVVNLLGIVLRGNPLLVLEYCQYGSLLSFLKMHRGTYFYDHVNQNGDLVPFDENEEVKLAADAKQSSSPRVGLLEENFDGLIMSSRDLINFSFQVCRGMEYLVSRCIIHRDLAARNVLVAEKKIVKISDFGMARERQAVYVLENNQALLPVKWMPPEAIVSKTFSQKSDVWSYGILLWEIFSLGETPYTGCAVANQLSDLLTFISDGRQMDRPSAAPNEVYGLQKLCWKLRPDDRPTFAELRKHLDLIVSADQIDTYLALEQPYQSFNKCNEDLLENMVLDEENSCTLSISEQSEEMSDKRKRELNYIETSFI